MSLQTPLMAMRVKTDIFAGSIALIANDGIAQRSAADSFKLQSTTYGGGGSPSRAGCTDVYIDPPARRSRSDRPAVSFRLAHIPRSCCRLTRGLHMYSTYVAHFSYDTTIPGGYMTYGYIQARCELHFFRRVLRRFVAPLELDHDRHVGRQASHSASLALGGGVCPSTSHLDGALSAIARQMRPSAPTPPLWRRRAGDKTRIPLCTGLPSSACAETKRASQPVEGRRERVEAGGFW